MRIKMARRSAYAAAHALGRLHYEHDAKHGCFSCSGRPPPSGTLLLECDGLSIFFLAAGRTTATKALERRQNFPASAAADFVGSAG